MRALISVLAVLVVLLLVLGGLAASARLRAYWTQRRVCRVCRQTLEPPAIERFEQVAAHGNRGHYQAPSAWPDSWIECADGARLSVIAGGGTYCLPRPAICACPHMEPHSPIGGVVEQSMPDEWRQYADGDGLFSYVPVALVRDYIAVHDLAPSPPRAAAGTVGLK
jgi:hypothetical protein